MARRSYLIPRRHVLKGLGAAVALPLLDIMSPAVTSAAGKKRDAAVRLCVLYKGCGFYPHTWDIAGGTETEFTLSPNLAPLKEFQEDLLVLGNLDHVYGKHNGSHLPAPSLSMTGAMPDKQHKSYHSVDQIVADEIGHLTPVKSLQLTADNMWKQHPWLNYLSHDRYGNHLAGQHDPRLVFNALFRNSGNTQYLETTASVLDDVKDNAQAVLKKASARDRETLSQYFAAIRDAEQQIDKFRAHGGRTGELVQETYDSHLGGKIKAMLDLIALSFWTDTTRVVSMMMANTNSRCHYDFIGVKEEFHYLSHYSRNRGCIPHYNKVNNWHTAQFAYLLERLKSYEEDGADILHNSVILYMSGIKHGDHHTFTNLPVVVAGAGGGRIQTGRHVVYPQPTPFPNLLLTLVDLMGVRRDKVGESTGRLSGIESAAGFKPTHVDDGGWQVLADDGRKLRAKGLLTVSDDINDTNAYYLVLSNKQRLEIRLPFLTAWKMNWGRQRRAGDHDRRQLPRRQGPKGHPRVDLPTRRRAVGRGRKMRTHVGRFSDEQASNEPPHREDWNPPGMDDHCRVA